MWQNSENLVEEVKKYFYLRFGIGEDFWENYTVYFRKDIGWLITPDIIDWDVTGDIRIYSLGFPFVRLLNKGLKPTSWGLSWLGKKITKNLINLRRQELEKILLQGRISYSCSMEPGYVALSFNCDVLGCGFYKQGVVESQIPKVRRKSLLEIISSL